MANVVSERVHVMKKNFIALHNEGYSIPEIAEKHNLSYGTVYRHLQEIAEENGVARSELLKIVRTSNNEHFLKEEEMKVHVDIEMLKHGFTEAEDSVRSLIGSINKIIEQEEEKEC